MELLVTYDVDTTEPGGQRRLRRVAKVCEAHGQRVQKSVFECTLTAAQLEMLMHKLEKEIDAGKDSLRIYRLQQPRERFLKVLGKPLANDIHDPLVI